MPIMPMLYLSHAHEDGKQVEALYDRLSAAGFRPWMVSKNVSPGADWMSSSQEAIRQADLFLAILSKHTAARGGYYEQELALALEVKGGKPPDAVYLIPVRLEVCDVPEALASIVWVDLFHEDGWDRLLAAISASPAWPAERPEPPAELVQAVAEGNCVLFAGSGLSARAGFPTWKTLVQSLLDWAADRGFIELKAAVSLHRAIGAGEINSAADSLVDALAQQGRAEELNEHLRQVFVAPRPPLPDTHRTLRKIPFAAALTTNFDPLLERTFEDAGRVYTPQDAEQALNDLNLGKFFVLKLYGRIEAPDNLLVAPDQYTAMVASNRRFAEFMASLFVSRTILFVGASLDGILDYLEGIQVQASERPHYALVAVAGAWETWADLLRRRYNIQLLSIPVSETFPEVPEFLDKLARRVRRASPELGKGARRVERGPARLSRVRLENIGPFGELNLELDGRWNILLGDNGVGKSTVLRSIALAMAGKDAARYATWLIKYGQEKGRVVLETTHGTQYVTELHRTRGEAEVISMPARPLETEGWLALGFPAFRNVGWQQPKGPQVPQARGPHPADLLPLMSSEPDPRIVDLKQWIVNLDYQASKEGDGRPRRLLDDFFAVVDRLTEGVTVKFGDVDPRTYQIMVITDDGEVPIEVLSQGTQSLIGWTGIMLERLYEVFGEKAQPRDQYALVLIDEISAHMHPTWQQAIVPMLTELFPRVQFIATTHSPLIVGGMPVEQVACLARDADGRVVELEIEPDMSLGRADQVLTSSLFGLETTLDRATQDQIQETQDLLAKAERAPGDEERLKDLRQDLEARIPASAPAWPERRAYELVSELLQQQVLELTGGTAPADDPALMQAQERLLKKTQQLIDEVEKSRRGQP